MTRALLLTRFRHQLQGLAFLVVAALVSWFCVAVYQKQFSTATLVTLDTAAVGNQMRPGADVKVRGVRIGEVRTITARGAAARLVLAIDPDELNLVPANVSARMLPKTLFGERYVALELPRYPARARLAAGDVIGQDRSSNAIELDRVLTDLLPTLDAVPPQKLSATLTSMATALDGRGATMGRTLVALNAYLTKLNTSLPDITADTRGLAAVSDTYDGLAPQLLRALADLGVTARTLDLRQGDLADTFAKVGGASDALTRFLRGNADNLVALGATAQRTLHLLADYSPEYPCLLRQIAERVPAAERAFGKGTATPDVMQVTLEIIDSRGAYRPGDEPRYDDTRGPRCYPQATAPAYFPQYPPGGPIQDGSAHPPPPRSTVNRTAGPDAQWQTLLTGILGWALRGGRP